MQRPLKRDVGLDAVISIHDSLRIDEKWTVWEARGFTWWGGHHAQRIWADPPIDGLGRELCRLHAQTDVFADFDGSDELVRLLMMLAPMSTLSGFIRNPKDPSTIQTASSFYVQPETLETVQELFSIIAATQLAEAANLAEGLRLFPMFRPPNRFPGAKSPHPTSGWGNETHEILEFVKVMVRPAGEQPSAYAGREMQELLSLLRQQGCSNPEGDELCVTDLRPFAGGECLIIYDTRPLHIRAANGLCCSLILPVKLEDHDLARAALDLNEAELSAPDGPAFLGSWQPMDGKLCFLGFYPNLCFRPGLVPNIAFNYMDRAKWLEDATSAPESANHGRTHQVHGTTSAGKASG